MQKQLSSFDIYVIGLELKDLIGSFIDKIYQISRDEILIKIKNVKTKQKQAIYIRNGEFLCLTQKDIITPDRPTTFAMTLRKYLQNGKISKISQHEFDRILKIQISRKKGNYSLIIEFFSNGNIILTDSDEKIILPLIRQAWAHRTVKGREPYKPPPSQINPFKLNKEEFYKLIKQSNSDIVRTLAVNINLSGQIAEEICRRAVIEKNKKIDEIKDEEIEKIYSILQNFLKIFENKKIDPHIVKKDGKIIDVIPFRFEKYKDFELEKTESLVNSLEKIIVKKPKKEKITIKKDDFTGRLERQLNQQKEGIKKFREQIDEKKKEGDLIYLHYNELEELFREISEVLDLKEKSDEIKKINKKELVKNFNPEKKYLTVNLIDTNKKSHEVKINYKKSVAENAENAYKENKKMKSKLKGAEKSIIKTKKQIADAKNKEKELQIKKEKEEKTTKQKSYWFEKYRWFISSDGNLIIGGKDAKTNDLVVKKYLKQGDRYAHADIQGAPSIVIKSKDINNNNIEISENTLREACIFAASYSKAWKQFAEAQSYWVLPEQVSKTAQSGEFVPKGAFIIRGKRNYQNCKLEIAVGEIDIQEDKKIMGGPISAVQTHSNKYVILEPGGIKKADIAKKLASAFNVNIDKINQILPSGGMQVIKSFGVEL
jgi:predicted ribosome quality control (RQC) complex YloA/Tae2 family protein